MAVCMFVKFNKEDYIDDQIPHLLFPMFFNLMSKTTHFVFRQNRSKKHIAFVQLGLPMGLDFLVPRDSHGTEEKKRVKKKLKKKI